VRALRRSPQVTSVLCAPGNAGIAADAECLPDVAADDAAAIVAAAKEHAVDLAAIGPEAGLVAGAVDALEAAGIPAFGPTKAAAELEGSKAFAKELMEEAGVPTAEYRLLRSREEALERLAATSYPTVLKADGLAAGKGVIICQSEEEAREAIDVFFTERRFGEDVTVVLEEFLEGEELSLLALCDGEHVLPLAPARDHKRALDGDLGPNTGGMGAFSPVPGVGDDLVDHIVATVHRPVVNELARLGTPFRGCLYAGLMLTAAGPRVIEFNVRFGDPEAQVILPRLDADLLDLLDRAATGSLAGAVAPGTSDACVSVVVAAEGYPEAPVAGAAISGLPAAEALEDVTVFHAGTAESAGTLVAAGGRVLNVTACGRDFAEARRRAYEAVGLIHLEGSMHRTDIALRAERMEHVHA